MLFFEPDYDIETHVDPEITRSIKVTDDERLGDIAYCVRYYLDAIASRFNDAFDHNNNDPA